MAVTDHRGPVRPAVTIGDNHPTITGEHDGERVVPQGIVATMERHQVLIHLAAIAAGAGVGFAAPTAGPGLAWAINPVLCALLYVTFLQVPAARLVRALRDWRFLTAVLVVNFVIVPLVVAAMFTFLPADQAVRLGVLLVLLCPCVDYVIVFSGLAGARLEVACPPTLW